MSENNKGFTFTWKIENFSMLPFKRGEDLESSTFVVDMWEGIEFFLTMYPRGDYTLESTGHVSLYFGKIPRESEIRLSYALQLESIETADNIVRNEENVNLRSGWGFPNFICRDEIYRKKNLFLPNDTLTIRLELKQADRSPAHEKVIYESVSPHYFRTKSCTSLTRIPVHRRSLLWPIENINECRDMQENSIKLASALKGTPNLKITCNFAETDVNHYIPIEIRQINFLPEYEQLFLKCKISVVGADKECQDFVESTHLFSLRFEDVFYFPPFIKTSSLTSDKYLYFDDTLLLQCDFSYSYKSQIYDLESNVMPFAFETKQLRRKTEFFKSIEELYSHGKFCDVRLQSGGETFPAYKMLLCARSSMFAAMFEHNMKEKNSNVINISKEVDSTTLKRMLDFVHVDTIKEELSVEDARKLYKAADFYNIVSLKRICCILLTSSLSVANVCDVLAFADTYNDNLLMNAAHSFISTHWRETFHSAHWESFMDDYPKLSMKIMHQWIKEKEF